MQASLTACKRFFQEFTLRVNSPPFFHKYRSRLSLQSGHSRPPPSIS